MAIKVNGTTVIDNSANITTSVGGFKTVGGVDITGSGNIDAAPSTDVNGVGTYTLAQDVSMGSGNSGRAGVIYKEGRTVAASNLRPVGFAWVTGTNKNNFSSPSPSASSTGGTNVSNSNTGPTSGTAGYSLSNGIGSNQSYSGSWRMMTPGAGPTSQTGTGQSQNWWNLFASLWVRYA